MKKEKTAETIQRMTVYFPSSLLEKVYQSANTSKRSFNKQVLWLVEESLVASNDDSRVIVK